ncbi:hypothetical protein TNCV_4204681 [Trichonephila clavipes]|nr:hypothetical protein TNCV_4204681 [Trichonephila clavipes]
MSMMRIATQTESALICKEYLSPFIVSIPVFPAPQITPFSDGQALKVHTVQGVVQNRPPPCSFLATVKTRYRSSSRLCRVTAFSPAVCRLFLLACKTMYRSSAGVVPSGRLY